MLPPILAGSKEKLRTSWLQLPGLKHVALLGLSYAAIHFSVSHSQHGALSSGFPVALPSLLPVGNLSTYLHAYGVHILGAVHHWVSRLLQASLQKHFLTGESREAWEQWTTQTMELKVVGTSVIYLTN